VLNASLRGADRYGLATLHAGLGQEAASIAAYRAALADPTLSPPLRRAARVALALALKRARRWNEALPLWRDAIKAEARRKTPDPWAHIELAKYHEHVTRDYPAAIAIVEAASTLLALRNISTWRDELGHRLARLQRKAVLHDLRTI
jgi:tetratricopeptide (TPR) repeat protein